MTRTSKKYISPDTREKMYEILVRAVSKAQNKGDVINFLTDMLSFPEREMLAKRLAIAYLLIKDDSTHREISHILKVGLGTIQRVSCVLTEGGTGYRKIIKSLMRDEQVESFMDRLAELLPQIPIKPGGNYGTLPRYRKPDKHTKKSSF